MPGNHRESYTALWRGVEVPTGQHILDCSVSTGKTTAALLAMGFRVTATNYETDRDPNIPAEADYRGGVDINSPLPFDDAAFDGVSLKDVMEHVENPAQTVREVARVLKPGGVFVFSTPNILNITSRLRFLFSGFSEGRKRPVSYAKPPGNASNIYTPNLPLLHYLLAQYGLEIEAMEMGLYSRKSLVLYPFLRPLIRLGTAIATRRPRIKDLLPKAIRQDTPDDVLEEMRVKQAGIQEDLARLMTSRPVLLGRNLMVRARKTGVAPMDAKSFRSPK